MNHTVTHADIREILDHFTGIPWLLVLLFLRTAPCSKDVAFIYHNQLQLRELKSCPKSSCRNHYLFLRKDTVGIL